MQNYSQNQEQQVILDYFGNKVGRLLSIGENDGETLSNSRAAPWLEAADKGLAAGFRLSQFLGLEAPLRLLLRVVVAIGDVHGSGGRVTYLR